MTAFGPSQSRAASAATDAALAVVPVAQQAAAEALRERGQALREQGQALRDQAQSMRNDAQAMRDAVHSGITLAPPDVQLRAMEYEHSRHQQNMVFAGILIVTLAAVIVLQPIARAFGRRLDGKRTGAPIATDESREQLQRMEQAIDAMAIEIERISEGQRFTTRLLSGRDEAMAPARAGDSATGRPG